ncbi:MAG: carbamoyltransferase C-terminal domain-containing protein [Candidatus Daviesbacteria bacterium]
MSKEQYLLGVNGYSRRTHNASAALLRNGELVAMVEEERFTRRKNAYGEVPHNAIAYCLDSQGIILDDVDVVGIGWDFNRLFQNAGRVAPSISDLAKMYFPKDKFQYTQYPRLELVPHHLAHAASTYFLSGFQDAGILIVDGQGENQSTSLYSARDNNIKLLAEFPVRDSLGYFYEAVSQYIGLSASEPGKTMGLAGYGQPIYDFDLIKLLPAGYQINLDLNAPQTEIDQQKDAADAWSEYLQQKFGIPNEPSYSYNPLLGRLIRNVVLGQNQMDIAASAQRSLELVALHLVNYLRQSAGSKNLCIAGGVGLNCSMNGRIVRERLFDNVFIPPFVNDAGVAVGAACYLSDKSIKQLTHAYLGPEFNNGQIQDVLHLLGIGFQHFDDISDVVARLVSSRNVVSWFQGRMEIGPRALGNRSILADPTSADNHIKVNQLKNREQWRPLAPSFLAEDMNEFIEYGEYSPFMIKAFATKEDKQARVPAVVHVDGTMRPQSVDMSVNSLYYSLIVKMKNYTGVPAILNTSFNQDSEPIVCSPLDAVRSFFSSGSNYLAIGDFLVSK